MTKHECRIHFDIRHSCFVISPVTPTGAEQRPDYTANPAGAEEALQMALQIADLARLVEAVGRLSPEQRATLLRALGLNGIK